MAIGIFIIIGFIILDQVTKFMIFSNMSLGQENIIIDDFFSISYHINNGAAWSLLAGETMFFYIVTFVALGIFIYCYKSVNFKNNKFYSYGLSLMISGTLGNFIDRIRIKGVVDFIDFKIFGYDFPVFNVADMCLVIGTAMFMISVIFYDN